MNYKKLYDSIIFNIRLKNRIRYKKNHKNYVYYEAHHILPRSLGGLGKCSEWRTHSNIILLTAREHYFCHQLLEKIYPGKKMFCALWFMVNGKNGERYCIKGSREYERLKIRFNEWNSLPTGRIVNKFNGQLSPMSLTQIALRKGCSIEEARKYTPGYGRKLSEEHKKVFNTKGLVKTEEQRKKISLSKTGKKLSEYHKKRIGEGGKGRKDSEETIRKRALSNIGKHSNPDVIEKIAKKRRGKKWYNNGSIQTLFYPNDEIKKGWIKGMLKIKDQAKKLQEEKASNN